jgi:hypothetical protein
MRMVVTDWLVRFSPAAGMLLLLAGWLSGMSACYVAVREPVHEVDGPYARSEEVYVEEAPPPPRAEVIVDAAPGPEYIWVGGYWGRYRDNWHWVNGRWAIRPHVNATWVDGRWDRGSRGYYWRNGHWR